MAQSYLILNFESNEDLAQQARHKLDGWQTAFHLGKKLQYKFDRADADKKEKSERVRILIRVAFSDHEKLSEQRWLARIPSEAPFKDASPKLVRHGEPEFAGTSELFEKLDQASRANPPRKQ